jgi:hypothetical protein
MSSTQQEIKPNTNVCALHIAAALLGSNLQTREGKYLHSEKRIGSSYKKQLDLNTPI